MIAELIKSSQLGDDAATVELIEKFNPLLKKFAYKLHYEDAYQDLLLDLIVILKKLNPELIRGPTEACLVSYIAKSIRCAYIKRVSNLCEETHKVCFSELSEEQMYYVDASSAQYDIYTTLNISDITSVITANEWDIIRLIFYEGYSAAEIAGQRGISRQTVNQVKQRALKKLYNSFMDKLG